jgi:predicted acyl esterase
MADVYRDIVMHGGNLDLEFIPMWLGMVDIMGALPPLLFAGEDKLLAPSLDNLREATDIWMDHVNNIPVTVGWILDTNNIDKNDFYDSKSTMLYWADKPAGGWDLSPEYPPGLGNTVIPEHLPVFLVGGWFDIFTRGTMNVWQYGLKNHTNADKSMIVGPWYHIDGSMGLGMTGLLNNEIAARWFDWKIKGITDPFMIEYPVLVYVLGEERWRAEKSWPLPADRTAKETLYLSKKKAPVSLLDSFTVKNMKNNYMMVKSPAKDDYYNSYWLFKTYYTPKDDPVLVHDPDDLHGAVSRSAVRWLMGMQALVSQVSKSMLNLDIDALMPWEDERDDEIGVLTFTTDTLTEDTEITGPLTLTFWARTEFGDPMDQTETYKLLMRLSENLNLDDTSIPLFMNKRDVQWVVEVNDVFKNGRARNISSGWLSAENRPYDPRNPSEIDGNYVAFDPFYDYGYRHPDPIAENRLYKYVVEVWPTENVFKKGHRIRVSLSASDFPHLFPVFRSSENTIVLDETHKACLDYTRVTGTAGAVWVDNPTDYVLSSLH